MKSELIVNLQVYPCSLKHASRILKTSNSLISQGLIQKDYIWATGNGDSERQLEIGMNQVLLMSRLPHNYRSLMKKSLFGFVSMLWKLVGYYLGIISKVRGLKPDFVTCRRVDLLPFCVLAMPFGKKVSRLIYSPHELESEKEGLSIILKRTFRVIERLFIRYTDSVIVVNEPIRNWYFDAYGHSSIYAIRNLPLANLALGLSKDILRNKFKIGSNEILCIYQGILSESRGIPYILKTFSSLRRKDLHIVFMGFGALENEIKKQSELHSNIHFQPSVPINEIVSYTASANIGIVFFPQNVGLSYEFCLPNKFGEYLNAGLPILVSSNLSYMSKLIKENKIGWVLDEKNENSLIDFLESITNKELQIRLHNVSIFSESFNWQEEEKIFKNPYKL